jgi:hypothetical protein
MTTGSRHVFSSGAEKEVPTCPGNSPRHRLATDHNVSGRRRRACCTGAQESPMRAGPRQLSGPTATRQWPHRILWLEHVLRCSDVNLRWPLTPALPALDLVIMETGKPPGPLSTVCPRLPILRRFARHIASSSYNICNIANLVNYLCMETSPQREKSLRLRESLRPRLLLLYCHGEM